MCGYTFRRRTCRKRRAHYCAPRADRAVAFYAEVLVHTKGRFARRQFSLRAWQEHDIIRPLFGEVVWSAEWDCYVRRYRIFYIVLARKNGKSELVAGIVLLLLVGDDEEAAEVYGAAKDTKQAAKVGDVVNRMRQLSPKLNGDRGGRLKHNRNSRRIFDERTASYFETITADETGELGHNPHGAYIDEVLSQRDGGLFRALRTAMGARHQPMLGLITTETDDPSGFGASEIDEAERIQEDPARAPHVFAYVRKLPGDDKELDRLRSLFPGHPDLPVSCDPFDERNWRWPNPALDEFLSRQALRDEALEAHNEPSKLNSFLQYRMNRRVQQRSRYIALHLWDAAKGEALANPAWLDDRLAGQPCVAGLDLSAKFDLTAWCLLFDSGWVRWRFWLPEDAIGDLDRHTAGKTSVWVRDGWITATDGDVIDYERVYDDIAADTQRFAVRRLVYDKWSGEPVRQAIVARTGLEMHESSNTYERMTEPLKELLALIKGSAKALGGGELPLRHGGNPVARWHADSLEVIKPRNDPDRMRLAKPERHGAGKRIDGMAALAHALEGRLMGTPPASVYETRGLTVL